VTRKRLKQITFSRDFGGFRDDTGRPLAGQIGKGVVGGKRQLIKVLGGILGPNPQLDCN
jgi:hypothetical protein